MREATALLTRREAAEIGEVSLNSVDKAVEQKVVPTRRKAGRTFLPTQAVPLLVLLHDVPLRLPTTTKRQVRDWLAGLDPDAVGAEFTLSEVLRLAYSEKIAEAHRRADEYVRLRDAYIESNPEVMGGEPVIRGTRVPVRGLARQIELGESVEVLREDYPHIPEEAYRVAVTWARGNPRRGRPAAPSRRDLRGTIARRAMKPRERQSFDPRDRARQKQASRDADARALRSGRKSAAQLREENEALAVPPGHRVRINLPAARSLS